METLASGYGLVRDLYIATQDNTEDPARGGTLFRVRVDVPGLPPPRATV